MRQFFHTLLAHRFDDAKVCEVWLQGCLRPRPRLFPLSQTANGLAANSGGQVCARLFKALLQRLGVTGSAHQG